MIYEVYITETLCRTERVDAKSKDEAIEAIRNLYEAEDIILDASDFVGVEFEATQYDAEDPQDKGASVEPSPGGENAI